jgi:enoyl-CoA hydratase / 3-hydroxyacyl-CoA dehydrogenase
MTIDEVKHVCFIGAGTMGTYNSLITALAGYQVTLYDTSAEALEMSPDRQRYWGPILEETNICKPAELESAVTRIKRTTDPVEATKNADFLSESVFEQLELKRKTHAQFDKLLPPHAIMTTNTSTLLLSDIESAVQRGDKFAAMHFHQPSPLVDIVAGPRTTPETIDIVQRFVKSQGQVYVLLKKERGGYLHNAMFAGLLGTAMMLAVLMGVDYQEVDQAWMINQKVPRGPFGMMDAVGLNVVYDVFDEMSNKEDDAGPEVYQALRAFLEPYVGKGNLGMKTGQGFYTYPDPEFLQSEFIAGKVENEDLSKPMVNGLLATALTLVADGHADLEDVDRSWMITHSPECGPFGVIDQVGLDVVKKNLEDRAVQMEALMGNPGTVLEATETALGLLNPLIEKGELGVKSGKGFYSYPNPDYQQADFLGIDIMSQFGRAI